MNTWAWLATGLEEEARYLRAKARKASFRASRLAVNGSPYAEACREAVVVYEGAAALLESQAKGYRERHEADVNLQRQGLRTALRTVGEQLRQEPEK